eukprot:g1548.t1
MPIAWHNPLTNETSLISATSWGTYATVGANLSQLAERGRHDCSHQVYKAINDSRPETFENHQWLQSVRVFPNGSGVALVHNEFHGEQEGIREYCSFDGKTPTGQCIEWSTDAARTADGGSTWQLVAAPVLTLPRRYIKDAALAGYGALGPMQFLSEDERETNEEGREEAKGDGDGDGDGNGDGNGDGDNGGKSIAGGYYYGHVYRSFHNGTGAGPPGVSAKGICAWRAQDPTDQASFRGWNGSAWASRWINPYAPLSSSPSPSTEPSLPPPDDLWKYTCATIDTGGDGSSHPNLKEFAASADVGGGAGAGAAAAADTAPAAAAAAPFGEDWPTHVMFGWPEGKAQVVSYSFASVRAAGGGRRRRTRRIHDEAQPFTEWSPAQYLDVSDWLDPHTLKGLKLMYPVLLDDDSPFTLRSKRQQDPVQAAADMLSYNLIGNRSLHLWAVFERQLIVRIPVAWQAPPSTKPRPEPPAGPFPPLPPVPANCSFVRVSGAGLAGVDGDYKKTSRGGGGGGGRGGGRGGGGVAGSMPKLEPGSYQKDSGHQIYCRAPSPRSKCRWVIAHRGTPPVMYEASTVNDGGTSVPAEGWTVASSFSGVPPFPTMACVG